MNPERWQRLDELFHSALERDGEARAAFLAKVCGSDDELLRELDSLLAHHEQAKSFMELPAYDLEAKSIVAVDSSQTRIGRSYQVVSGLPSDVESLMDSHEHGQSFIVESVRDLDEQLLSKDDVGLDIGCSVGPYKILSVLGIGGMGEVYLA